MEIYTSGLPITGGTLTGPLNFSGSTSASNTAVAIYRALTADLFQTVPTNSLLHFQVNTSDIVTIGSAGVMITSGALTFAGFATIVNTQYLTGVVSGVLTTNVPTNSTYAWQVNGTTALALSSSTLTSSVGVSVTGNLTVSAQATVGTNLVFSSTGAITTTQYQMSVVGTTLTGNVPTSSGWAFQVNGTNIVNFTANGFTSTATLFTLNNGAVNLNGTGGIGSLASTNYYLARDASNNIVVNIGTTTASVSFQVAGVSKGYFSNTGLQVNLITPQSSGGTMSLQGIGTAGGVTIYGGGNSTSGGGIETYGSTQGTYPGYVRYIAYATNALHQFLTNGVVIQNKNPYGNSRPNTTLAVSTTYTLLNSYLAGTYVIADNTTGFTAQINSAGTITLINAPSYYVTTAPGAGQIQLTVTSGKLTAVTGTSLPSGVTTLETPGRL